MIGRMSRRCEIQLGEFLRGIKKEPARADFAAMINILITHAQSPEELLQVGAGPRCTKDTHIHTPDNIMCVVI